MVISVTRIIIINKTTTYWKKCRPRSFISIFIHLSASYPEQVCGCAWAITDDVVLNAAVTTIEIATRKCILTHRMVCSRKFNGTTLRFLSSTKFYDAVVMRSTSHDVVRNLSRSAFVSAVHIVWVRRSTGWGGGGVSERRTW